MNARKREVPFTITLADIPDTPKYCPVFPWIKLVRPVGKGRGDHQDGPSVDRIIPELGYIPGNLRIISMRANRLKCDGTVKEMQAIVKDLKRIEREFRKK